MNRHMIMGGVAALLLTIAAPHEALADKRDRNRAAATALGAGIGLLGGAIVSDGDPWATLGGAVAGGAVGNLAVGRGHRDRWERRDRDRWDRDRDRRHDRRDWDRGRDRDRRPDWDRR